FGLALRQLQEGYGSRWADHLVAKLAEIEIDVSRSTVYRLVKFVDLYDQPKAIESYDGRIGWEIMQMLISVEDATTRARILDSAVEKKLSGRAVRSEIQKSIPYRRARDRKGPSRKSAHPLQAIRQIRSLCEK